MAGVASALFVQARRESLWYESVIYAESIASISPLVRTGVAVGAGAFLKTQQARGFLVTCRLQRISLPGRLLALSDSKSHRSPFSLHRPCGRHDTALQPPPLWGARGLALVNCSWTTLSLCPILIDVSY